MIMTTNNATLLHDLVDTGWVRLTKAADDSGIAKSTICDWRQSGKIISLKIGSAVLVYYPSLTAYAKRHNREVQRNTQRTIERGKKSRLFKRLFKVA